jgi:hypothetical protein
MPKRSLLRLSVFLLLATPWLCAQFLIPRHAQAQSAPEEFFEKRVRPLLATHCYDCHTDQPKGGLRVDGRDALLKGGSRGPAIVAGEADKSVLILAVTHQHPTLRMPKGEAKLSDDAIADLRRWINEGAVWPAATTAKNNYVIKPEHKAFWSFQPIVKSAPPSVRGRTNNAIDSFLLARLESKKLSFNPPADKRTLLRRVTFDLTGLPPTPDEISAFERDHSPDAFAKVVGRLLASPHYGERWGRHWLDIARYSDTLGMIDAGRNLQQWFPYAYTYRDWVVRAFNDDLPYDEFIRQQLAADKLPSNERRNLAALGFLALTRGGLNVTREERVDDKVDLVTRGLLGLTVSCARCHNHKFDPIPTADYYSLYTIFANTKEPEELPLLHTVANKTDRFAQEIEAERQKIESEIAARRQKRYPELLALYRSAPEIAKSLMGVANSQMLKTDRERTQFAQEKDYNGYMLDRWRAYLKRVGDDDVWMLWTQLSAIPEKDFKAKAAAAIAKSKDELHPLVAQSVTAPPETLQAVADAYGKLLTAHDKDEPLTDPQAERLRLVLRGLDAPTTVPFADYEKIHLSVDGQDERGKRRRIDNLFLKHAYQGAPPRAQCLEDSDKPQPGFIFIRGNSRNKGASVDPQFLQILSDEARRPFSKGRERLELANAITDARNPLTARVIANRVWAWHFGAGLVTSLSDFGTRGEAPSHPGLLDFLASGLIENKWSLKWLHRQILSSRAYQQSSRDHAAAHKVDPENQLWWRYNRRRLDWEELRDGLLATSGQLDPRLGGLPESAIAWPYPNRRTIYSFIDRALVPNDFRAFDFASPDTHVPQRYLTTTPQQALLLMNAPFVHEQARALAARVRETTDARARIERLYQLVYGRRPTSEELSLGLQFIGRADGPADKTRDEWQYGQGEYDEKSGRIVSFNKLTYFFNEQWRNSGMPGDPRDTTASLHAKGGTPGDGKTQMPIRRWVATFDGRVKVSGKLSHNFENSCRKCDGMIGRLVSSHRGEQGKWTALQNVVPTEVSEIPVQRGEALDFVVTPGKGAGNNEFGWTIVIDRLDTERERWDSQRDFRAPYKRTLTVWEQYAQVLLMAAEFMTVE